MHPKHPKKDIDRLLDVAEALGCRVERRRAGHRWGLIIGPDGEWQSVYSTPRDPVRHARRLRRWLKRYEESE